MKNFQIWSILSCVKEGGIKIRLTQNEKREYKEYLDRMYPRRTKFKYNDDVTFCFQFSAGGGFHSIVVAGMKGQIDWLDEQANWSWDNDLKVYRWRDYFKFYIRQNEF